VKSTARMSRLVLGNPVGIRSATMNARHSRFFAMLEGFLEKLRGSGGGVRLPL
jgi:hypothetical protein